MEAWLPQSSKTQQNRPQRLPRNTYERLMCSWWYSQCGARRAAQARQTCLKNITALTADWLAMAWYPKGIEIVIFNTRCVSHFLYIWQNLIGDDLWMISNIRLLWSLWHRIAWSINTCIVLCCAIGSLECTHGRRWDSVAKAWGFSCLLICAVKCD